MLHKCRASLRKPVRRNYRARVVFVSWALIFPVMKRAAKTTIWVLLVALLSAGARAIAPDATVNQYNGIADRNVFNLHSPSVRESPVPEPPKPPPTVTLDGITTILEKKIVILTVAPTKPGSAPHTLMLAEGQAEDDVEVTSIDEKAGVVKVINHGESETLDFDYNGTKPVATGPGTPATRVTIPPIPAAAPVNNQPFPDVIRPIRTIPTRSPGGPLGGGSNAGGGA